MQKKRSANWACKCPLGKSLCRMFIICRPSSSYKEPLKIANARREGPCNMVCIGYPDNGDRPLGDIHHLRYFVGWHSVFPSLLKLANGRLRLILPRGIRTFWNNTRRVSSKMAHWHSSGTRYSKSDNPTRNPTCRSPPQAKISDRPHVSLLPAIKCSLLLGYPLRKGNFTER